MSSKGSLKNPTGPHLSEANFRRFESILSELVATYPAPYIFEVSSLAPTTVAARLRDAVNAIFQHGFQTQLDITRLRALWPEVTVQIKDSKIVVATREAQREVVPVRDLGPTLLTISNPSLSVLSALAVLLSERALTDPVLLLGPLPPFSPPPGIVLEPNSDGSHTML